jgi:hypothetical protein
VPSLEDQVAAGKLTGATAEQKRKIHQWRSQSVDLSIGTLRSEVLD